MKTLNQHELKQVGGGVEPGDFTDWVVLSSETSNLLNVLSHLADILNAGRT